MHVSKFDNHNEALDADTMYFVDKIGYLISHIDKNYDQSIRKILFDRIFETVQQFQTDLPNLLNNQRDNRAELVEELKKQYIVEEYKTEDKPIPSNKKNNITEQDNLDENPKVQSIRTKSPILNASIATIEEEIRLEQLAKKIQKVSSVHNNNSENITIVDKSSKINKLSEWEKRWLNTNGEDPRKKLVPLQK